VSVMYGLFVVIGFEVSVSVVCGVALWLRDVCVYQGQGANRRVQTRSVRCVWWVTVCNLIGYRVCGVVTLGPVASFDFCRSVCELRKRVGF
jgi:hypothetical protein